MNRRLAVRVVIAIFCIAYVAASGRADIRRWDNGQLIPGTEGIVPERGVDLRTLDLSYADLRDQVLSESVLWRTNLSQANLSGARLSNANLWYTDLTGAEIAGASMDVVTQVGFKAEQLYSTASYEARNLSGVRLSVNDLSGWDFSGQNLTGGSFYGSKLADTDLSGARIAHADFGITTDYGFTADQLYSTASYQEGDLRGVKLQYNDLRGWNLAGQDLTGANLADSQLSGANLAGATLVRAKLDYSNLVGNDLSDADLAWANLSLAGLRDANLTRADFTGARFVRANLVLADLRDARFPGAFLLNASLRAANLAGANLKSSDLSQAMLAEAVFDTQTVYNQWTVFPEDFDPVAAGLTFEPSLRADFSGSGTLDVDDVNLLMREVEYFRTLGLLPMYDLDGDLELSLNDLRLWVTDHARTWFGDANLDGEFNSRDLVVVFQAGQYEDEINSNSTWETGDWNADGEFTSADIVWAFDDGGYEAGPRNAAVPEPTGILLAVGAVAFGTTRRHWRSKTRRT